MINFALRLFSSGLSKSLFSLNVFSQCKREHWKDAVKEQETEGCQVYGYVEVSKVCSIDNLLESYCGLFPCFFQSIFEV